MRREMAAMRREIQNMKDDTDPVLASGIARMRRRALEHERIVAEDAA